MYGPVPDLLPPIEQMDAINEESLDRPGTIRHTHRLREISVQQIMEGTARERAARALNTRSLPPSKIMELNVGDKVDFFRTPNNKDVSGWQGPATVVDVTTADRGNIWIKHIHRPMVCRLGDERLHIPFLVLLAHFRSLMSRQVATWHDACNQVEQLGRGQHMFLGKSSVQEIGLKREILATTHDNYLNNWFT